MVCSAASETNVDAEILGEAVAVRHDACIFLDQVGPHQFIVTNTLTTDRFKCPAGDWLIEYDSESGDAVLFQSTEEDDGQVLMVEDMFNKVAFYHARSDEYFVQCHGKPAQSLDSFRTRYSEAEITVKSGVTCATFSLKASVFHHPRFANQRMFWGLLQCYSSFNMQAYKQQRSIWLAKQKPRIQKFLASAMGQCNMVHSNHGNSKAEDVHWRDQCLAETSVCTVSMLLLLSRWALASRESGGLGEAVPRKASLECLQAFLHPVLHLQKEERIRILAVEA